MIGLSQVKLLLKEKLDRESEQQYRMRLLAVDGGEEAMTGSASLTINVLDVNDNRPRFSQPLYEVSLTENTPPGTVVVTVEALDHDEGLNGAVEFQFSVSTQESVASRVFSVNSSTGQIVVKVRHHLVQPRGTTTIQHWRSHGESWDTYLPTFENMHGSRNSSKFAWN